MWEIYSDGAEPYPGLTRLQTRAKLVVQNYHMDVPKECPPEVGKVMLSCWEKDPNKRPEVRFLGRLRSDLDDSYLQAAQEDRQSLTHTIKIFETGLESCGKAKGFTCKRFSEE